MSRRYGPVQEVLVACVGALEGCKPLEAAREFMLWILTSYIYTILYYIMICYILFYSSMLYDGVSERPRLRWPTIEGHRLRESQTQGRDLRAGEVLFSS